MYAPSDKWFRQGIKETRYVTAEDRKNLHKVCPTVDALSRPYKPIKRQARSKVCSVLISLQLVAATPGSNEFTHGWGVLLVEGIPCTRHKVWRVVDISSAPQQRLTSQEVQTAGVAWCDRQMSFRIIYAWDHAGEHQSWREMNQVTTDRRERSNGCRIVDSRYDSARNWLIRQTFQTKEDWRYS